MAESTKKEWREFSQRLNSKYTPRQLGEAMLSLAEKKPSQPRSDRRIWVAVIIGSLALLSAVGWREVTNSRALAAQVEEITEAHAEAEEQARIAEEERAKAAKVTNTVKAISSQFLERGRAELLGLREQAANEVTGEPFVSIRTAGEILKQGGIEDAEFWQRYDGAMIEILTRLAQYLNPDVTEVVIIESKDGQP